MKVVWIDNKSILTSGKKKFKAGDIIPGGLLTASRIDELVKAKKIKIEGEVKPEIKVEKPETKSYETKKASVKEEVKKVEELSLIDEELKSDKEEIDLGI